MGKLAGGLERGLSRRPLLETVWVRRRGISETEHIEIKNKMTKKEKEWKTETRNRTGQRDGKSRNTKTNEQTILG